MMQFGLVGKKLQHSFSKNYFREKFHREKLEDFSYENFEIRSIEEWPALLKSHPNLKGLNITIPYKEEVIRFLDELDPLASAVGAVNCVTICGGRTKGYNTDVYGFQQSIKPFLDVNHERALVLGTGGASRAVTYALRNVGVQVLIVSSDPMKKREGVFHYSDLNAAMMAACKLVINTTPLGTFPDTTSCPDIPYQCFSTQHLAYDLVYNPAETSFMRKAAEHGAMTMNGLSMLQLQAEKSWEIWQR